MSVLTLGGKPYDWTKANPRDKVMLGRGSTPVVAADGVRVIGSLFTIAWLDWMDGVCLRRFGVHLGIIQPSFHTGVPQSAGTHDLDGCEDFTLFIPGQDGWATQRFIRQCFGWAWFRHPPLFSNHVHGGPVGILEHGLPVGIFVPGQVADYYAGAFGLANQHTPGSDRTWAPRNRRAVWPYAAYVQEMIDTMPLSDSDIAKVAKATAAELLGANVGPADDATTVKTALYRASNIPALIRAKVDRIITKIGA